MPAGPTFSSAAGSNASAGPRLLGAGGAAAGVGGGLLSGGVGDEEPVVSEQMKEVLRVVFSKDGTYAQEVSRVDQLA